MTKANTKGAARPSKFMPRAESYYKSQGVSLMGGGAIRDGICQFSDDGTTHRLQVHIPSGAFNCEVCGKHGSDLIAFHSFRYRLTFKQACKSLGLWIGIRSTSNWRMSKVAK